MHIRRQDLFVSKGVLSLKTQPEEESLKFLTELTLICFSRFGLAYVLSGFIENKEREPSLL